MSGKQNTRRGSAPLSGTIPRPAPRAHHAATQGLPSAPEMPQSPTRQQRRAYLRAAASVGTESVLASVTVDLSRRERRALAFAGACATWRRGSDARKAV